MKFGQLTEHKVGYIFLQKSCRKWYTGRLVPDLFLVFKKDLYEIKASGEHLRLRDTHRENALMNKTQKLTKSMTMDIWVISTLNQLFIRGSYTEIKFSKK